MEKSAFKTTLAHGPGHPAGGVKENGLGEKSAKTKLLNNVTTQGVVAGRGRVGSAVAVLPEPITNPGGGIVWADIALAVSIRQTIANIFVVRKEEEGFCMKEKGFCVVGEKSCICCLHGAGQILITRRKRGQTREDCGHMIVAGYQRLIFVSSRWMADSNNASCRANSPANMIDIAHRVVVAVI